MRKALLIPFLAASAIAQMPEHFYTDDLAEFDGLERSRLEKIADEVRNPMFKEEARKKFKEDVVPIYLRPNKEEYRANVIAMIRAGIQAGSDVKHYLSGDRKGLMVWLYNSDLARDIRWLEQLDGRNPQLFQEIVEKVQDNYLVEVYH